MFLISTNHLVCCLGRFIDFLYSNLNYFIISQHIYIYISSWVVLMLCSFSIYLSSEWFRYNQTYLDHVCWALSIINLVIRAQTCRWLIVWPNHGILWVWARSYPESYRPSGLWSGQTMETFGYGQGRIQNVLGLVAYQVAKPWEPLGMGKVVCRALPT